MSYSFRFNQYTSDNQLSLINAQSSNDEKHGWYWDRGRWRINLDEALEYGVNRGGGYVFNVIDWPRFVLFCYMSLTAKRYMHCGWNSVSVAKLTFWITRKNEFGAEVQQSMSWCQRCWHSAELKVQVLHTDRNTENISLGTKVIAVFSYADFFDDAIFRQTKILLFLTPTLSL